VAAIDGAASRVLLALRNTLTDPHGLWIVSPHADAASERPLISPSTSIRLDRTFLAGPEPLAPGSSTRWIVDFKTGTHGTQGLDLFLDEQQALYTPQMARYAHELRGEPHPLRVGLFYPLLSRFLWWEPGIGA
jgi:ATP-dependent helicase/nuclease subunit A